MAGAKVPARQAGIVPASNKKEEAPGELFQRYLDLAQQGAFHELQDRSICRHRRRCSRGIRRVCQRANFIAGAAIDTSLKSAIERKDVPGVVALVTDRKGVIYEGAFGVADVATGRPLKEDALFRIASMTKPVTSLALMQLVEQGKIGLDDPAEKYLPELKNPQVVTSFDAKTGDYQLRPAARPAAGPAFPDPHLGIGLSVHQRDLA